MTARTEPGLTARILVIDRSSELAARLRHHVVAGGAALVKACPDTARAEAHLASAHWDAVVAGPSLMHRAGLRRLASLHARYPWVSKVLALHERPRADLAEIVQAGASDLIPLHADDDDLRRILARAARITRARLGGASPAGDGRGRIVMVSSASGGCGKTFLATNAAEFLARTTGAPVVLLDLDLQFGEVSTALRLRPEVTITDALAAEAEGCDLEDVLDEFLLPHPDGFKVLAAPRHPAEADSVTPGDVTRILDVLRARRAWVVIDTHEGLSDLFVAALEATDHVFAVATPDRPSLVNLGRFLSALERLGMSAGSISVVLNKAEADTGLDPLEMAVELGRHHEAVVPYSREVALSVNVGVPLVAGKPKSPITALLTEALSAVLPGSRRPQPVVVAPAPAAAAPAPAPAPAPATAPPAPVIDLRPPEAPPEIAGPPAADPAVPDPPAAGEVLPDGADEPVEIDLTDAPRRCPAVVPARPPRCRRSTEPAIPCAGRGPPPNDSPHSSRSLVHSPPPNDPTGLSGKPRTPPTREERESAVKPHVQRRNHGDAPVLTDVDTRSCDLRDRGRRRPRLVHGLG